jgi:cytochrome c-type biogenesis protein CcmE
MKKIHIVAIIMIAVAIGLLTTAADDMSTYSNFSDAIESGEKVKIAGQLAKDKEMIYDPEVDPNYFSFYVEDTEGIQKKVILNAAKPQDFELSEQIVLTGKMNGDEFFASDMLMKCPSKYKDEEIYVKGQEGTL